MMGWLRWSFVTPLLLMRLMALCLGTRSLCPVESSFVVLDTEGQSIIDNLPFSHLVLNRFNALGLPPNSEFPEAWSEMIEMRTICPLQNDSSRGLNASLQSPSSPGSVKNASRERTYEYYLKQYPAATKSLTAAFVSLLGDSLSQLVEIYFSRRDEFNLGRAFSVSAEGLFVSGPILHFAYDAFEHIVSNLNIQNKWLDSAIQVLLDIMVLDTFFAGTLMVTTAVLQGRSNDILKELSNDFPSVVRAAWLSSLLMAPLQLLNFGVIPLRYRVLITNFQDVLWNAAVSTFAHKSRE